MAKECRAWEFWIFDAEIDSTVYTRACTIKDMFNLVAHGEFTTTMNGKVSFSRTPTLLHAFSSEFQ
ncbi:MAG: hypothetical protein N2235_15460 [Fischerella sp.]|nr:hypothetical protein [Fischerella sp.]